MKIKLSFLFGCAILLSEAAAQCHFPTDISLDSTANLLWEWALERIPDYSKDGYKNKYESLKKYAAILKYDSLFRVSRQYLIDELGEDIFCKRVDMDLWYATVFYQSHCDFEFRFFTDDVGQNKKIHFKKYRFAFYFDTATGEIEKSHFPEVLDCRDNPSLCEFKVVNENEALKIAKEAGLVSEEDRIFSRSYSTSGWTWEIEKRLNDDCLAQKVLVDMYTGEAKLSETYSWLGCTPLAKKVESSPIVIEGTVLENGTGFKAKQGIWSSRLVEVNRIFKGEISPQVIEVIALGGVLGGLGTSLSHGQFSLPGKGATAIYYLRSPWDDPNIEDGRAIDSLSAYPVFYVHYYQPLELYPTYSNKLSFHLDIEHNTYQPIEKAAGKKRQNIRLPAVPDSAFVDWAVHRLRKYPVRERGLEYQIFNKHYGKPQDQDTVRLRLGIRSPSLHSYLTKGKIVLRYNPSALGDSIVSKKRLKFSPMYRNPDSPGFSFGSILPPDSYRFELKDLTDSTFQILIIRPEGEGEYFQVTPFNYSKVLPALPIAELEVPILDKEANLAFDFWDKPMQSGNFHFDFEKGEEVPYFFVWPNDQRDYWSDPYWPRR